MLEPLSYPLGSRSNIHLCWWASLHNSPIKESRVQRCLVVLSCDTSIFCTTRSPAGTAQIFSGIVTRAVQLALRCALLLTAEPRTIGSLSEPNTLTFVHYVGTNAFSWHCVRTRQITTNPYGQFRSFSFLHQVELLEFGVAQIFSGIITQQYHTSAPVFRQPTRPFTLRYTQGARVTIRKVVVTCSIHPPPGRFCVVHCPRTSS